jgi:hypothetical protein
VGDGTDQIVSAGAVPADRALRDVIQFGAGIGFDDLRVANLLVGRRAGRRVALHA